MSKPIPHSDESGDISFKDALDDFHFISKYFLERYGNRPGSEGKKMFSIGHMCYAVCHLLDYDGFTSVIPLVDNHGPVTKQVQVFVTDAPKHLGEPGKRETMKGLLDERAELRLTNETLREEVDNLERALGAAIDASPKSKSFTDMLSKFKVK